MNNPKILYIEDNRDNQRLVERVLGARGYQILIAEDGPSGISMARESHPALILVDLGLPGLDGYETTTRLRSLPHLAGVPIIALTADSSTSAREHALVAGCDGYLTKPIDTRQLPQQISQFLGGYREQISSESDERKLLRSYNQKLVERLEQQVRELSTANAALQELDTLKSQFLATLSHELRTPLTALIGYIELFDRGMLGPLSPPQSEAMRVMRRSSNILSQQLNNLLYFQELRSHTFQLRRINIRDILQQSLVLFTERAEQAGIRFELQGLEVAPILADASGIEQLVRNLVDNAIKFTQAGGWVRLTFEDEPSRLIIRVEDNGIGIPTECQEKIFLPFYRVDNSLASGYAGSGLGLAIVQHVLNAHGGQITVRSAPDQGSIFTVVLPRAVAVRG